MNRMTPIRYFLVIKLHSASGLAVLLAVLVVGIWTVMISPAELDAGLGSLLVVQMFLASSGFVIRARRGHFDPLLAGQTDMTAAAAGHWIVSVLPGLTAWLVLGICGWVVGSPLALSALAGKRAAAMFLVSAVAWCAGFLLPRGAAGVMWTGALIALMVRHIPLLPAYAGASPSGVAIVRSILTIIGCPFLLLGNTPGLAPFAVPFAALLAAMALLLVWRTAGEVDIPLVDRA